MSWCQAGWNRLSRCRSDRYQLCSTDTARAETDLVNTGPTADADLANLTCTGPTETGPAETDPAIANPTDSDPAETSPAENGSTGTGQHQASIKVSANLYGKDDEPEVKPGGDSDIPDYPGEIFTGRPTRPTNCGWTDGQAGFRELSESAEKQHPVSRASMAFRPEGPASSMFRPCPELDFGTLCFYLVLVIGSLLLLFTVQKYLGGIFQAVLNSEATTRPEKRHSSQDYRLENTVCWLVVTLTVLQIEPTLVQTLFGPWEIGRAHV